MNFTNFCLLIILVTSAAYIHVAVGTKVCDKVRNEFANALMEFERCAIQKAVPVTFCRDCKELYIGNLQYFKELQNTTDTDDARTLCINHYVDQDSLNILRKQFEHSVNLWNDAHCTNCFVPKCTPDNITSADNVTEICQPSADYNKIQENIEALNKCVNQSDVNRTEVCKECLPKYSAVADGLKRLQSNAAGVCFEIIDKVNRTSRMWYENRKCTEPIMPSVGSSWLFILLLIPFGGFGAGGYMVYKKYRTRSEYNQPNSFNDDDDDDDPPLS